HVRRYPTPRTPQWPACKNILGSTVATSGGGRWPSCPTRQTAPSLPSGSRRTSAWPAEASPLPEGRPPLRGVRRAAPSRRKGAALDLQAHPGEHLGQLAHRVSILVALGFR